MVDSCSSITAILSAASALDMEDGVESSFEVIMLRPVILENLLLHVVVAMKVMMLSLTFSRSVISFTTFYNICP